MKSAFSFLPQWPLTFDAVFWIGLALFIAGIFGEWCWRTWRLPRITGYALVGLFAGTAGFNVITPALTSNVRLLIDIALGLLLFELGSRLSIQWIRNNPWLIFTSLAEACFTFFAVFIVLFLLKFSFMTAIVVAAISIATSPAMIIQLKNELKSEGQVSERLMLLAALNTMYAVITVKLVSGWLHLAFYANVMASIFQPIYLIFGSLILAYLLAKSCHFLYRRFSLQQENSFVTLMGLVLLAIAIAHLLKLSTVIALLSAGIIFKNISQRPKLWPPHFGSAGWFLTVMLFVLTLVTFGWNDLMIGGFGALALVLVRIIAKTGGVLIFAKPSGLNWQQGLILGISLSPMSALAYLLMDDIYLLYPNFDPAAHAIILCSIFLMQLIAPLLIYRGLSFLNERTQ